MHNLLKIIKLYLIQKELEVNETQTQILLARAMKRRGLDDFFEKKLLVAKEAHLKQGFRHAHFHYLNYRLAEEELDHIMLLRRQGDIQLTPWSRSLTTFFAAETLRQAAIGISMEDVSKQVFDAPMLESVLQLVENGYFDEDTEGGVVRVYYNALMALKTHNVLFFNELKQLIIKNRYQFPDHEIRNVYLLAINFCIRRINADETAFRQEAFDLYEAGLANRALFENGILSKFTFKNAISAGTMMGKDEWVREFLEFGKQFLHPKEREAVYSYNLAVFHFGKGDYSAATVLLQRSDFGDVLTNLASRALLLRIYFETGADDALASLCDSFQTFLNRQKALNNQKDSYLNRIRFVRKLLRADLCNPIARQQIHDEMAQTTYLAGRNWLMQKVSF